MFWIVAFIFWFSLLFGTYVTGNAIDAWIALIGLLLFIRWRRLVRSRASAERSETTAGTPRTSSASAIATSTPAAVSRAPGDALPRTRSGRRRR